VKNLRLWDSQSQQSITQVSNTSRSFITANLWTLTPSNRLAVDQKNKWGVNNKISLENN
jgi:hypothetical protein